MTTLAPVPPQMRARINSRIQRYFPGEKLPDPAPVNPNGPWPSVKEWATQPIDFKIGDKVKIVSNGTTIGEDTGVISRIMSRFASVMMDHLPETQTPRHVPERFLQKIT